MTAEQIINEIRQLPSLEQQEVIRSVVLMDKARLSSETLAAKAIELSNATDPKRIASLRDELERGFYGSVPHA